MKKLLLITILIIGVITVVSAQDPGCGPWKPNPENSLEECRMCAASCMPTCWPYVECRPVGTQDPNGSDMVAYITFNGVSDNIKQLMQKDAQFLFARTQEIIGMDVPAPCEGGNPWCQYDSQVIWGGCVYDIYLCFNELGSYYCSKAVGC